jgi:alpha-L-fucosidase 2
MKQSIRFLFVVVLLLINIGVSSAVELKLWYDKPATVWEEALPLGNGSLGAMVMGDTKTERIFLNESSVWSGQNYFNENSGMLGVLPEIRKALFDGDNAKADSLAAKYCTSKLDPRYGSYQPLGDLWLTFDNFQDSVLLYKRVLNLNTATATVEYSTKSATFRRELFISNVDKVMVMKLTCSKKNNLSFTVALNRQQGAVSALNENNELVLDGKCDFGGSTFHAQAKVVATGGKVETKDGKIIVNKADEVLIYLSANTDFWKKDPIAQTNSILNSVSKKAYGQLLKDHVADYQSLFNRVDLTLEGNSNSQLPTDQRIKLFQKSEDPSLSALLFHYGRYLLISCSRPGGLPANLQGIWNHKFKPPWYGDFTVNINYQMNYWPAEVCNLSELTQPFFEQMERMYPAGKKSAKVRYGCNGWQMSTRSTPWGVDELRANSNLLFQESAAWLCTHIWEHYQFTGDTAFLRKYYPLIHDAALFYTEFLVKDPKSGFLVSGPTTSPENLFEGADGQKHSVVMGTTMSTQVINDIFTICNASATLLGVDTDFRKLVLEKKSKLLPMRIGSRGQLLEWMEEYKELDPHHRHVSHLYGLYPSNQINNERPELMSAARKTLEYRGDISSGWSMAWKTCFWARLQDGEHANKMLSVFFNLKGQTGTEEIKGGGVYPNLFCCHPPFQIDGNFGISAAIAEMLMQSQGAEILLLPALPKSWQNGEVKGLKARGGLTISMIWKEGKVKTLTLKSDKEGTYKIKIANQHREFKLDANKEMNYEI